MSIHSTNIAALPFVLFAWVLSTYFLLMSVRLLLGQWKQIRSHELYRAVQRIADTVPRWMEGHLQRWLDDYPPCLPWVCAILGVWTGEQVLVRVAISLG